MVTIQTTQNFQKSIDELERAMATPPDRNSNRFSRPLYTAAEKREIMGRATQAGKEGRITLKESIILEDRLKKNRPIPQDFLRHIGFQSIEKSIRDGLVSRREVLQQLSEAVGEGLLTMRDFSRADTRLNRGLMSPSQLLRSLEDYRAEKMVTFLSKLSNVA